MVRLTEQADGSPDMIRAYAVSGIAKYGDIPVKGTVIGVGGTFTSLAAMSQGLKVYNPEKVKDYVLEKSEVERIENELIVAETPERIREMYPVLPVIRSELITAGAIFVHELMTYLGVESMKVSEADNLDGYARYKHLS